MTFLRPAVVVLSVFVAAPALADPPPRQVYSKPQRIQPGGYADPYYGRQNGQICPRWCLEDRNPCDPPDMKIADGRCFDD